MTDSNEVGGVLKGALARWPIILVAALVVGAVAFGYALVSTDGPSIEAVSAVRFETVPGLPVQPTVDMGVATAKAPDVQASAAESAGVEVSAIEVNAFADPNDVQLVRISVKSDDAETAEAVATEIAMLTSARVLEILEPDLSHAAAGVGFSEERIEAIEADREKYADLLASEGLSPADQAAIVGLERSLQSAVWAAEDRLEQSQFNLDRFYGAVKVEGEAVAVEVSNRSEIIAMTLQGLLIGAIAGVAVAFLLSLGDRRRRS